MTTPESLTLLQPMAALLAWSMIMWLWMYVTRLPAVRAARMQLDPARPRGEQMNELPAAVRWKADNYNHLMEQLTLFYAAVLGLVVAGDASAWALGLAWAYTALRVVHSLWQAMSNVIEIRFVLFVLSSLALFGLVARLAAAAW